MSTIEFQLGNRRPSKPNETVLKSIKEGIDKTLGPNAKFVATSGKGNYGSVRHRNGDAVDGYFVDGSGQKVSLSDRRMQAIILACASEGITGFGAGTEYMGNFVVHMDVYPLSKYTNTMGRAWGSYGNSIESRFIQASKPSGGGVGVPTNIHPKPRKEYNLDYVEEDSNNQDTQNYNKSLINPLGDDRLDIYNPFTGQRVGFNNNINTNQNPFLRNPYNLS